MWWCLFQSWPGNFNQDFFLQNPNRTKAMLDEVAKLDRTCQFLWASVWVSETSVLTSLANVQACRHPLMQWQGEWTHIPATYVWCYFKASKVSVARLWAQNTSNVWALVVIFQDFMTVGLLISFWPVVASHTWSKAPFSKPFTLASLKFAVLLYPSYESWSLLIWLQTLSLKSFVGCWVPYSLIPNYVFHIHTNPLTFTSAEYQNVWRIH